MAEGPEAHHYPPTTAEWVTSPLPERDELERNPLESALPARPRVRLAALLIIVSGILSLAGLIVQVYQTNFASFVGWSVFWHYALSSVVLPLVTMIFAIGGVVNGVALRSRESRRSVFQIIQFATAGSFLQLLNIPLAFLQIVAAGNRSGQTIGGLLGPAYWLTLASFLLMLATAWIIMIVARPPATEEDVTGAARSKYLEDLQRNGGDARNTKIPFFGGKQ